MEYKEVQKIAKDTIVYARKTIQSGMTLADIRELCEKKLMELGADSFWYGFGPFKLVGGIAKGHPTEDEVRKAVEFCKGLKL